MVLSFSCKDFALMGALVSAVYLSACEKKSDSGNGQSQKNSMEAWSVNPAPPKPTTAAPLPNAAPSPAPSTPPTPKVEELEAAPEEREPIVDTEKDKALKAACSGCHAFPDPKQFTMKTWGRAINYMYRLFEKDPEGSKGMPPIEEVFAFYGARAPMKIDPPPRYPAHQGQPSFSRLELDLDSNPVVVSDVVAGPIGSEGFHFAFGNMLSGQIFAGRVGEKAYAEVGRVAHPARLTVADLDGDGLRDVLVADLGQFRTGDTKKGSVVWFRAQKNGGFKKKTLLKGLGRVAKVSVGDVTGDERADLLVADFGWQKSGQLLLLTQKGKPSAPTFRRKILDAKHGAVAADFADIDGDGDVDIVAAFSQAREEIVVYLNDKGKFESRSLFKSGNSLWGLLGQRIVDIDGDGDLDVVHFNGDNLDAPKFASFQGVYLLENKGALVFENRQLAILPGTHEVLVGDADSDKDLDIIALASLPPGVEETLSMIPDPADTAPPGDGILLLTQSAQGRFEASVMQAQDACYVGGDAYDYDADGDLDFFLGHFGMGWDLINHGIGDGVRLPINSRCPGRYEIALLENGGVPMAPDTPSRPVGTRNEAQSRLRDLVKAYEWLVESEPASAVYRNQLGLALLETGRLQASVNTLRKATDLSPDFVTGWNNLAFALIQVGELEESIKASERAIKLDPTYGLAYGSKANALVKLGRLDEAIAVGKQATELQPRNAVLRINLANTLVMANKPDEALTHIQIAHAIIPGHPMVVGLARRISQMMGYAQPAPQGGPPQGAGPYGQPPQGAGPYGQPPQGAGPYGQPPQGAGPYGRPPQGAGPYGRPPQSAGPYGQPPQGAGPYGRPPQGAGPYGRPPQGAGPYGRPPQGAGPYGRPPQGAGPYGRPPQRRGMGPRNALPRPGTIPKPGSGTGVKIIE